MLASCTTSVYVNLSKNSFLVAPTFWAKADAKVRLFSEPPNFYGLFLQKKLQVFVFLDKPTILHLIIYKGDLLPISK